MSDVTESTKFFATLHCGHDDIHAGRQGHGGGVNDDVVIMGIGHVDVEKTVNVSLASGVSLVLGAPGRALVEATEIYGLGDAPFERTVETDVQRARVVA